MLVGSTVGDENASQHGAENNAEGDHLEAQGGHVTPGSKCPVLLLQGGERRDWRAEEIQTVKLKTSTKVQKF